MITKGLMSSNSNEWCTPQYLFDELDAEFGFTLDPACTHENAKCKKHYTAEEDGLSQNWAGETVFCNPPYGREIGKWVKKCHDEWQKNNITIVMLIPARTDTSYFHEYVYKKAQLRFLKGRVKFEMNGSDKGGCAPFPSMIVIFEKEE